MKRIKKSELEKMTLEQRNERLRAWLKDHDLLNLAKLCRRIPYDRGAFQHFEEQALDLSDEPLTKVENILKKYGYAAYPN